MRTIAIWILLVSLLGCKLRPTHTTKEHQPSSPADLQAINYPGLEGLKLDLWTEGFFKESSSSSKHSQSIKQQILNAYQRSSKVSGLYHKLLKNGLNQNLSKAQEYKELVDGLFAARKAFRSKSYKDIEKVRGAILLMQVLAEETLYALHLKFPNYPKMWKTVYHHRLPQKSCIDEKGLTRTSTFLDVVVCQGDIVLSKGGSGSSSFIARTSEFPGNFSHSTAVYVQPETREVLFPEAYIEDGVKLRPVQKDYVEHQKKKLSIYRYTAKNKVKVINHGVKAIEKYVAKMVTQLESMGLGKADLSSTPCFEYDFGMDAMSADSYFCSEIPFAAYQTVGVKDMENPYPTMNWSQISGIRKEFYAKLLNIRTDRFPAPSDIDLHPYYDIVAFMIDISKLQEDRVDVAMVDVLMQLMQQHSHLVEPLLSKMDQLGNTPITENQINYFTTVLGLPKEKVEAIKGKIPANINLKQLLFFGYLNQKLTPNIRKALHQIERHQISNLKRPMGLLELRVAVLKVIKPALEQLMNKFNQIPLR